jgi:DNA-binding transcriptional regulator WhiA
VLDIISAYDDFMDSITVIADMGCGSGLDIEWFATLCDRDDPPRPYNYVCYVQFLMTKLFNVPATICSKKNGYHDVYIGSVELTRWLYREGLVSNKVAAQVGVPDWLFTEKGYMRAFLRGFFDTDGSVYKLRFGIQISFTNRSIPLLIALQAMLRRLGYRVSELSLFRIYITRRDDVERFFAEIQPMNAKHQDRYEYLTRR